MEHTVVNLWPLLGVAVIIAGFALRAHPVLVVVAERMRAIDACACSRKP